MRDGEAVGDLHRVLVHGACGRERKGEQRVRGAPRGERALPRGRGGQGRAGRRLSPSSVPITRAAPSLRRSKLSTMEASTTGCSRTTRPPGKGPESAADSGAAGGGAGAAGAVGAAAGGALPAGAGGAAVGLCGGAAAGGAALGAVAAILQEREAGFFVPTVIG